MGQDLWAERVAQDHEERLVIYYGVEAGKVQGKFQARFSCAREYSQDTGGLASVMVWWFSL